MSLRHGGAGPVAGRRGGRWTRALRGSRPVGRRRRLRLCEADCAWEGGDGCRAARGRRTRGGGGSLGRAVSMANWQGYVSISQFPAHLISDTRTRHGYVSVPYPYRIRIRHGIRVYPGVSVFLSCSPIYGLSILLVCQVLLSFIDKIEFFIESLYNGP